MENDRVRIEREEENKHRNSPAENKKNQQGDHPQDVTVVTFQIPSTFEGDG